nr:MAG TPA: hypothetical protein [Caudoviricetes sp.]
MESPLLNGNYIVERINRIKNLFYVIYTQYIIQYNKINSKKLNYFVITYSM